MLRRYSRSEDSSEDPNDKDVMSADDPPAHPDYDKLRAAGEADGKPPERDSSRPPDLFVYYLRHYCMY